MTSLHVAPVGLDSHANPVNRMPNIEFFGQVEKVQFVPEPSPIPALAGPGTSGLGLPSSRNYSYSSQSSPAPSRTCPQPSSGILVQHAG